MRGGFDSAVTERGEGGHQPAPVRFGPGTGRAGAGAEEGLTSKAKESRVSVQQKNKRNCEGWGESRTTNTNTKKTSQFLRHPASLVAGKKKSRARAVIWLLFFFFFLLELLSLAALFTALRPAGFHLSSSFLYVYVWGILLLLLLLFQQRPLLDRSRFARIALLLQRKKCCCCCCCCFFFASFDGTFQVGLCSPRHLFDPDSHPHCTSRRLAQYPLWHALPFAPSKTSTAQAWQLCRLVLAVDRLSSELSIQRYQYCVDIRFQVGICPSAPLEPRTTLLLSAGHFEIS